MSIYDFSVKTMDSQTVSLADYKGKVLIIVNTATGCGFLKAISKLVDGWTVEKIEEYLLGNTCGRRPTSCADQLAIAVRQALEGKLEAV